MPLPELTPSRWLTAWSLDVPALLALLVIAAAYLLLARRVAWPVRSTLWFLVAGLGSIAVCTMSFLGTYDEVLLWPLAVQDVLLMTVVPIGLTAGRPLALLQAVFPRDRSGSRLTRVLSFPLVGSLLAVSTLLAVYTTGWDEARLDSTALLELTRVLLVVVGCLFLWPLLGVDSGTGQTSYPIRAGIAFLDGLLDAIPGLAVLGTGHVIAAAHYASVHRTYANDQSIGGTAMVALSELVGLPAMLVLLVQWMRSDARQAHVVDARLDDAEGVDVGVPWWETDAGPLADRFRRE